MNILLWILQLMLALHTAIGAFWKFSHSAQTVPPLKALPPGVWHGMGFVELACGAGLILPLLVKSWGQLAPLAAIVIALEMALFCILHLQSGEGQPGHLVYWLVVAALCGVIAYGRLKSNPV
jgi:hypothetical protein